MSIKPILNYFLEFDKLTFKKQNSSKKELMMQANWKNFIVSTPDILNGKPRINGTRIPVSLILGYLAAGNSFDEIIKEFPDITREQIAACLDYARDLSEFEVAI